MFNFSRQVRLANIDKLLQSRGLIADMFGRLMNSKVLIFGDDQVMTRDVLEDVVEGSS